MHYSYTPKSVDQAVRAKVSDLRCHFKNTRNTAHVLRGLTIQKARRLLKDVLSRKRCIPFFRHSTHTGRTAQAKEWKTTRGRWPVKSCNALLEMLRNLKSNADHKGLKSPQDLVITHIAVQRAMKQRRRTYRAHGRIGPYMCSPCHVEICAEKSSTGVKKPSSKPLN